MLTIDRYIMQQFIAGVFLVLVLLLSLFSFLALADELGNVGKGGFTLPDALMVVILTTPKRVVELLPVTTLLGGLMGLGAMANQLEIIAIRANGISKQRIALTVTMLAIFLGIFVSLLQFSVVPASEREASQLRGKSIPGTEADVGNTQAFWTRNGPWFIRVNEVQFDRRLKDLEIYKTDSMGRLEQLVQADVADYADAENWLLSGVVQTTVQNSEVSVRQHESMLWTELLSVEQAAVLMLPLEALAPDDLIRTIANLRRNKLDTHRYEIVLWQQVSLLPGLLAMALLSLPFLLGSVRNVSASQRAIIGGLIGIGFYLVQQLSGHMAGLMGLNPSLVILTPSFILLAIAIFAIRHHRL